jgi:hypothetical protein
MRGAPVVRLRVAICRFGQGRGTHRTPVPRDRHQHRVRRNLGGARDPHRPAAPGCAAQTCRRSLIPGTPSSGFLIAKPATARRIIRGPDDFLPDSLPAIQALAESGVAPHA